MGPLSRYVSGFAWAVSSAFRTISLCRAQVEWQRACGVKWHGHTLNCRPEQCAVSGSGTQTTASTR
jgi:hypothetical protein